MFTGTRRTIRHRTPLRAAGARKTSYKILVGAAAALLALSVLILVGHASGTVAMKVTPSVHIVYQARTSTDGPLTLPASVAARLTQIGQSDGTIRVTRIDGSQSSSTTLDMTPRTAGHETRDPSRRVAQIQETLTSLTKTMNVPARDGARALYTGLRTTRFSADIPVIVFGNELDLADPVDTRSLAFNVNVDSALTALGETLPDLAGASVTFVPTPTAAPQAALGPAETDYLDRLWSAILIKGQAQSVVITRSEVTDTSALRDDPPRPPSPIVPVPNLPSTPVQPVVAADGAMSCPLTGTYFTLDRADLLSPAQAANDLQDCVRRALKGNSTLAIDAYASYEGPLDSEGRPIEHSAHNLALSEGRAQTLAKLLVNQLGVDPNLIERVDGHGDHDLPDPTHPASENNRVALITASVD